MNGFRSETRQGGRRYPLDQPHPVDVFSGDFGDNFTSIRQEQQRSGRSSVPAHLLRSENGFSKPAPPPPPPPRAHLGPESSFDLESWAHQHQQQQNHLNHVHQQNGHSVPWRQQFEAEPHHQQQNPQDFRGQFRSITDQTSRLIDDLRDPYSLALPGKPSVGEISPPRPPARNPQPYFPYRRPTSALADPFAYSTHSQTLQNRPKKSIDPLRQHNKDQLPSIPVHLRSPFASSFVDPVDHVRVTHRTFSEPNGHQNQIHALDILSTSLYDPNSAYYSARPSESDAREHLLNNNKVYFSDNDDFDREDDDMSRTTPNWRNNFSQVRDRFGSPFDGPDQQLPYAHDFSFASDGSLTMPRSRGLMKSTSQSAVQMGGEQNRSSSLLREALNRRSTDNSFNGHGFRRKSETPEPSKKGLGSFWIETVRNRASSPSIQRVPFKPATAAQERLEQLHEPLDDEVPVQIHQNNLNDSGHNANNNRNGNVQAANHVGGGVSPHVNGTSPGRTVVAPFRRVGTDSVAQRKLNFLAENEGLQNGASSTSSTSSFTGQRLFPSERFVSERKTATNGTPQPRPFTSLDEAVADLQKNTERLIDSRGCGKFPLDEFNAALPVKRIGVFTGSRMSPPRNVHTTNFSRQLQHSPSPDSLSGESTASLANLPHPKPKHNIREQLMNAGAGNTYLGPYMGRRPSTPNFPTPLSGTVASKISVFEKRPGTPTLLQLAVGTANNHHHHPEPPRSPLSPRTTTFRTKPVIHVDLGHELKERGGAISPEYDNKRIETVSTSAAFHFPKNQPAFSPRWRNDPVNEAQPLSAPRVGQMGTGTTPTVIKLNTPPMKCNVDFGLDQSTSNLSLTTATTIATAKSLSFNDSINLTAAEPKKLPPVTTPTRSKVAGRLANSEKFYFPTGKPLSKMENDGVLRGVQKYFGGRQLLFKDFAEIARIVGFPVYSKRAIFEACCRCNSKPITDATAVPFEAFAKYWEKMILQNHDEASRFVFTLTVAKTGLPARNYLVREDFHSMFYDLIQTYPGLQFLIEATQFHARYVEVVTARIFWNVNRSWSGKITVAELRQSNLLPTMHLLEETDEINKITEYFSYEHFYVIYCKFWELDEDHDMVISKDDMRMHCNGALTNRIIDRIFSTAVTRVPRKPGCPPPPKSGVLEVIGFEEFVAFLLAEEDKRHPKAVEYWFRCIDLDGDGIISLYEMEMFYKDVALKIQQKGYETLDFKDVASQLYDLVSPGSGQIMLKDLKKCGLAHRFFNTFVNYLKYLEQESADGERASVKMNGDKEMSDWDQFCALEYEMLMTEADQGEDGNDEAYDLVVDDDEQEDMTSANIGSNDSAVNGF